MPASKKQTKLENALKAIGRNYGITSFKGGVVVKMDGTLSEEEINDLCAQSGYEAAEAILTLKFQ